MDGRIHRGADGAAGDIGHIRVAADGAEEIICSCGNVGCLEAMAGDGAMARRLTDEGVNAAIDAASGPPGESAPV